MKKQIVLTFLLAACLCSYGQYAPRYLFLEHFTNTRCVLCPGPNAAFYALLDSIPGIFHQMSVHPSVPYNNCALYLHNPVENNARRSLYNISATPQCYLWGQYAGAGNPLLPAAVLQSARGQQADLSIEVDQQITGLDIHVQVRVKMHKPLSGNNLRLFVALTEDSLYYTGPNGEPLHHRVFRKMLPDVAGTIFTPGAPGEVQTYSFSQPLHFEWDTAHLRALVFVQDLLSKTVINSGAPGDLRLRSEVSGDSIRAMVSGGIPPYVFHWSDPDSQQSALAVNLAPGLYTLTVTDAAGIRIQDTVRINSTTASDRSFDPEALRIFPQPAGDHLMIEKTSPQAGILSLRSLQGQVVMEHIPLDGQRVVLPVGHLSAGIYVLVWRSESGMLSKKILISRP